MTSLLTQLSNRETVPCGLCGTQRSHPLFDIKGFTIVRCESCDLVYTNPRLKKEVLPQVYDEKYFKSDDSLVHGYEDYALDQPAIQRTFQKRWELMSRFIQKKKGRILDVGCAYGFLLDLVRKEGWGTKGLDASSHAVQFAQQKLKLDVEKSDLTSFSFPPNSFDVVVMWDVIEHVPNPIQTLQSTYDVLKPGGILSLITPDQGSLSARLMKQKWVEYQKPDEHLYFFSKKTMDDLFRKTGFKRVWRGTAGKIVTVGFALERLKAYQPHVFGLLNQMATKTRMDSINVPVNPMDKMFVLGQKK